jgi:hypothetical protein
VSWGAGRARAGGQLAGLCLCRSEMGRLRERATIFVLRASELGGNVSRSCVFPICACSRPRGASFGPRRPGPTRAGVRLVPDGAWRESLAGGSGRSGRFQRWDPGAARTVSRLDKRSTAASRGGQNARLVRLPRMRTVSETGAVAGCESKADGGPRSSGGSLAGSRAFSLVDGSAARNRTQGGQRRPCRCLTGCGHRRASCGQGVSSVARGCVLCGSVFAQRAAGTLPADLAFHRVGHLSSFDALV